MYKNKYLKYKNKYLNLLKGGSDNIAVIPMSQILREFWNNYDHDAFFNKLNPATLENITQYLNTNSNKVNSNRELEDFDSAYTTWKNKKDHKNLVKNIHEMIDHASALNKPYLAGRSFSDLVEIKNFFNTEYNKYILSCSEPLQALKAAYDKKEKWRYGGWQIDSKPHEDNIDVERMMFHANNLNKPYFETLDLITLEKIDEFCINATDAIIQRLASSYKDSLIEFRDKYLEFKSKIKNENVMEIL